MILKVLLISLIYNMSLGLWSPPVGDKFDKELFDRNQKDGFYEYHHDDYTVVLSDLGNMYKRVIYPDSSAFEYGTTYYKKELTVMGTATTLYGMFIGEIRSYDIQGKLTEIRDMDAPYKYTIELYFLYDDIYNYHFFDTYQIIPYQTCRQQVVTINLYSYYKLS